MKGSDEQCVGKFKNSKFKIWIHIEEINEEENSYQDVGEPISIGEFNSLRFALDMRDTIYHAVYQGALDTLIDI